MKISVVTVSLNSERTIRNTLESFIRQVHPEKELLVVDGGSRDGTLKLIEAFNCADIRVMSGSDAGPYDAMNKGLRNFTGDAVGILNSDDTFHDEHALARIAQGLEGADIVYGDLHMVTDHQTKQIVRDWRAGRHGRYAFQMGWMPPHPTFYIRRRVVDRTGAFDLKYRIAADYDFMLRAMAFKDFRALYVPHVLVDFQMGGISTGDWRATMRTNLESLRSRRDNLGAPLIDAAFFLRFARRLFQLRRISGYWKG